MEIEMIIAKPLSFIHKLIRYSAEFILRILFLQNGKYYFSQSYGTDNSYILIVKNIINPSRFLKKFFYGQIIQIPSVMCKSTEVKIEKTPPIEWQNYIETLKRDGIVFIPRYYEVQSQYLNEKYALSRDNFPSNSKYKIFNADLNDSNILKITTDPLLLTILSSFYGYQPYLRDLPSINCTHPKVENERLPKGFNDFWHYDTVNQTTAHILLNTISKIDNCMLFAKGSHQKHRVQLSDKKDYCYSEEYVRKNYDIVPCVGDKGTLIIFDPNGLHRVDLKAGTFRAHLHLNFTLGNDMISSAKDGLTADTAEKISYLKDFQRESLAKLASLNP